MTTETVPLSDSSIQENSLIKYSEPEINLDAEPLEEVGSSLVLPRRQYAWRNIIALGILHFLALYALPYLPSAKWATFLWGYFIMLAAHSGIQTGAHRLWAHRTYKATFGLRLWLTLCQTMALQNDIYEWCRDHRGHHKWSDTNADPHNSTRGFFFSHVGWLMVKKHPEVIRKGKTIDLSDLRADGVVMFQRRFYIPLVLLFWGLIPAAVPVYGWGEAWTHSVLGVVIFRYVVSLNLTWLVNSWAHMYGNRPFDKGICPVEASCRNWLLGEGFHNYHHTFPWDYSASELGAWDLFNLGTVMINLYAKLGLAWDLKKVHPRLIAARYGSTGVLEEKYESGHFWKEYSAGLRILLFPVLFLWASKWILN